MKAIELAALNKEFGQFQLPNKTGHEPTMKLAEAYLDAKAEVINLGIQKKILFSNLEFARDDINELQGLNIVLTLKVNAEQAINYTHWFIHVLGFAGFGFVAWSLTNMGG